MAKTLDRGSSGGERGGTSAGSASQLRLWTAVRSKRPVESVSMTI